MYHIRLIHNRVPYCWWIARVLLLFFSWPSKTTGNCSWCFMYTLFQHHLHIWFFSESFCQVEYERQLGDKWAFQLWHPVDGISFKELPACVYIIVWRKAKLFWFSQASLIGLYFLFYFILFLLELWGYFISSFSLISSEFIQTTACILASSIRHSSLRKGGLLYCLDNRKDSASYGMATDASVFVFRSN